MDYFKMLEKYSELILKKGINIQPGQNVILRTNTNAMDLNRIIVKKAYELGAFNVYTDILDDEISRLHLAMAPDESLEKFYTYKIDGFTKMLKENAAVITIICPNPDLYKDISPVRLGSFNKAMSLASKEFGTVISNSESSWTIAAVVSDEWAKKVYPDLELQLAKEKLWEKVYEATRVNLDDPIDAWNKHSSLLSEKCKALNDYNFKYLHYNSLTCDLKIQLADDHVWLGGSEKNKNGVEFIANIPTEEVFTVNNKFGINGKVKSTKPLNLSGTMVTNFSFEFKDGKIIDFSAETGYDILKSYLEIDEGARYIGEVALVPFNSPISNTDIVFQNTLFDENASCHLAFGRAYPTCVKGGDIMTEDELDKAFINRSLTHVDFMVGSNDLSIVGETFHGEKIEVFNKGNWAF